MASSQARIRPSFVERLLPMLAAAVRALVDELLVLPVRDLEPVQPEVPQLDGRQAPVFEDSPRDADHPLRSLVLFIEREASDAHRPADVRRDLDGLEPLLFDPKAQVRERNAQRFQGRPAQRLPARVHLPVGLHQDVGAGGIRLDGEGERVVDEEASKGGIAGQVRLRPPGEEEGVVVVLLLDQTGYLRERDIAGPARAGPSRPPRGQTGHAQDHDDRRDGRAPSAQGRAPPGYGRAEPDPRPALLRARLVRARGLEGARRDPSSGIPEAAAERRPAPFRAARSNPARARGRRRPCPTACPGRTPAGRPASRRARSRTTRRRCAHPSRARVPAPATCRPWFR